MTHIDQLVARSAELKAELLAFSRGKRFERALVGALEEEFGRGPVDDKVMINFFDHFLLQHTLTDGRTVVERFVRARGDLPRSERDMLLGWRDVVEGAFEVERIEGEVLVAVNLIDELTYRIRTNAGAELFAQTPPGSFLMARVVPIVEEWLLSGALATFSAEEGDLICRIAAESAMRHPQLALRNPERLARAWQFQREDRARFIELFGSDVVVVPGADVAARMAEHWRRASGTSTAPPFDSGPLAGARTVGMIYDEAEGLSFFAEFGLFQEAFENPELMSLPQYRDVVLGYLEDETVSPLPFRRCAEADASRADRVFARLLGKSSFNWVRDGDALLRSAKADYFAQDPTPRNVPLGPRLAAQLAVSGTREEALSAGSGGRPAVTQRDGPTPWAERMP